MLFHPFTLHQTKNFRQCDRVGRWKLVGLTQIAEHSSALLAPRAPQKPYTRYF
jgi:hypothetical protein